LADKTIGDKLERQSYKRRSAAKNRNDQGGKHPEIKAMAVARTRAPHGMRDNYYYYYYYYYYIKLLFTINVRKEKP